MRETIATYRLLCEPGWLSTLIAIRSLPVR